MNDRFEQAHGSITGPSWRGRLRALQAANRKIAAARDWREALRIAVESASSLFGAEASVLVSVEPEDDCAHVEASVGVPEEQAASFRAPGGPLLGEEIRRAFAWPEERVLRVSLALGDHTGGLLAVVLPPEKAPDEAEELLLSLLADHVTYTLESAVRADERRALSEISDVLASSSLDYQDTQRRVARLAVDLLGGLCGVMEVRADGRFGRTVVLDADPAKQAFADSMQASLSRDPGALVLRAVETRAPVLVNLDEIIPVRSGDEERIALHRKRGTRAILVLPMISRGQLVGVLGVSSPRIFRSSDVSLAQEMARRAAVTIDNARLFEESRFQAAVAAHLAEGILLTRVDDGTIVHANARAEEMFGYEPGELLGKDAAILSPLRLEDRRSLVAQALQEAESDGSWHGEVPNLRKGGDQFWSSVSASIFDHPEVGKVFLTARVDITARKALEAANERALREKEVLLKEVHHRVKNNLQVISSLFYLQRWRATDPQTRGLLDDCRGRVESIALIHEQLYQSSSLAGIDFHEYLNRLLAAILSTFDLKDVRARFAARGVVLDVDQAVPCALIASELVSNSLKHAFLGRGGELWVTASLEGGHTVVLEVRDNGVGFPSNFEWSAAPGLGLRLVQSLTKQLRGTLELDGSHGTRFTLRFPLASAPPAGPEKTPGRAG